MLSYGLRTDLGYKIFSEIRFFSSTLSWTLTLLHLLLRGLVSCASSSGGRKGWSVGRRKMKAKKGKGGAADGDRLQLVDLAS